jgi:hypothetical protein
MSLILDGTNGLSDVDGSAATPAIRGSDANTGVFFGTDIVGLSTGGSERVRVNASGAVNIGTTANYGGLLSINRAQTSGVAEMLTLRCGSTGTVSTFNYFADPAKGTALRFDYGGAYYAIRDGTTERLRIDSSGNLLVGATAVVVGVSGAGKGIELNEAGYIGTKRNSTEQSGQISFNNPNGQVGLISTTGSSTTYATSSDYRLKHDIQPMSGALTKVAQLKPVTYKWNADDSQSQGFIAHELQEVVPECVTGEKDAVDAEGNPQYQGIDTSFLVATLTAAIQELKGINDAQAQIITALTARVETLEGAQ